MKRTFFLCLFGVMLALLRQDCAVAGEFKFVTEYRYPTSFRVIPITTVRNGVAMVTGGIVIPENFVTREVGVIMSTEAEVANANGNVIEIKNLAFRQTTPLMTAATSGDLLAVRGLLGNGVIVNARNQAGSTALMNAAAGGFVEIAKLLLYHNAQVDTVAEDGRTALMFAAANGHTNVVNLLLDKGAKIDLADKTGATAIGYAERNGHKGIAEALRSKHLERFQAAHSLAARK